MTKLLEADEAHPAEVINETGASPFVLICEHASNILPRSLGTLGLTESDLNRHIAYDIGAASTARMLSRLLDAPLILQRYSRLAYDCNRPPEAPSAMPESTHTARNAIRSPGPKKYAPQNVSTATTIDAPQAARLPKRREAQSQHGAARAPAMK